MFSGVGLLDRSQVASCSSLTYRAARGPKYITVELFNEKIEEAPKKAGRAKKVGFETMGQEPRQAPWRPI